MRSRFAWLIDEMQSSTKDTKGTKGENREMQLRAYPEFEFPLLFLFVPFVSFVDDFC